MSNGISFIFYLQLILAAEHLQESMARYYQRASPPLPPYPDLEGLSLEEAHHAPPRPPLPSESNVAYYPETTDDESEDWFHAAPTPSRGPIMVSVDETFDISKIMLFFLRWRLMICTKK